MSARVMLEVTESDASQLRVVLAARNELALAHTEAERRELERKQAEDLARAAEMKAKAAREAESMAGDHLSLAQIYFDEACQALVCWEGAA